MSLPSFQLLRPKSLEEAVALMARHDGEVKIIAGGTDLLPSMKQKLFTPPYVIDLGASASCAEFEICPATASRSARSQH